MAAAAGFGQARSIGWISRSIAKRVVQDALAYLAMDPFEGMLSTAAARQKAETAPIAELARSPLVDTTTEITALRLDRFKARNCQQLTATQWEAETREIAAIVERKLAKRYANHLRK